MELAIAALEQLQGSAETDIKYCWERVEEYQGLVEHYQARLTDALDTYTKVVNRSEHVRRALMVLHAHEDADDR